MEHYSRRHRRGRCYSQFPPPQPYSRVKAFFGGLQSFLIMGSLMALIYMTLEHHCKTCTAKCDLNKLSSSIDEIALNFSDMKMNYYLLETRIASLSKELPKIEGQIEVLEALGNTLTNGGFGWDPKNHIPLPNVDVYLSRPVRKYFRYQMRNGTKTSKNVVPKAVQVK